VALVPAVNSSFQERFALAPIGEGDYDERAAYVKAAEMMIADHPLGIGANHFAVIGNLGLYYARAGVHAFGMSLAGNVHNFYYLTAAETGYPGLMALLFLLSCVLIVALRCGWRYSGRDYRGDLVLGLGVAILCVSLHSWVEWSLATFEAEYLLAIAIGLVAGNAQQLGYWSVRRFNTAVQPGRLAPAIPAANSINGEIGSSSRKR
jgi:O-antigen ligase